MPKDAWKPTRDRNATRRAKADQWASKSKKRVESKARTKKKQAIMQARICRPETALWFGKHKGTRICDLPLSYIHWLAALQPTSAPMQHLVCYLRTYRRPTQGPSPMPDPEIHTKGTG